jgi:hypothetical protein
MAISYWIGEKCCTGESRGWLCVQPQEAPDSDNVEFLRATAPRKAMTKQALGLDTGNGSPIKQ